MGKSFVSGPGPAMLRLPEDSSTSKRTYRRGESGYALLFVIFLVASIMLLAAAASPNVLTEGRRQKEQEMVWRGNQYVRAVSLFYRKNGRYPQSLEELAKPNAANVHFLRKAYREPMNAADGSWRLIYVSPTGQLIGSVHFRTLQEMAVAYAFSAQGGGSASAMAAQLFGQPTGTAVVGQSAGLGAPNQSIQNQSQGISSSAQPAPLGNLAAVDGPVFGGSVIGVAGKEKQASIRVYQGGTTYFEWEFIWNPTLNANLGQIPAAPGQTPGPGGVPTAPPGVPVPSPVSPTAPASLQPQITTPPSEMRPQ
jgi:hypothetical protein